MTDPRATFDNVKRLHNEHDCDMGYGCRACKELGEIFAAIPTDAVVAKTPVELPIDAPIPNDADYWVCGTNLDDDEPSFGDDYETRDAALASAVTELTHVAIGEPFQIGRVTKSFAAPTSPLHAGHVIEQAGDGMHGVWISELCDGWETKASEHVSDLQKRLDDVWKAWTEENKLRIGVLALEDVETHIMLAPESPVKL